MEVICFICGEVIRPDDQYMIYQKGKLCHSSCAIEFMQMISEEEERGEYIG